MAALSEGEFSASRRGRFIPCNEKQYALNRRLGDLQSRSWRFGEQNNILPVPGFKSQTFQPVT
jgi:hypothetical protein